MSHSHTPAAALPASSQSRFWNATLWFLQISLAINFLMAGSMKLVGAEPMVVMFDAIELGQWFRFFTGGVEVLGAVLLVIPRVAGVGATLLALVMVGAVSAELFVLSGPATFPAILLIVSAAVAYGRREQIRRVLTPRLL